MNAVETKAKNEGKRAAFEAGRTLAAPGTDTDAGGANLAKPFPTQTGGDGHNKGRLKPGTEVHHVAGTRNGNDKADGTQSIPDSAQIKASGSSVPPR